MVFSKSLWLGIACLSWASAGLADPDREWKEEDVRVVGVTVRGKTYPVVAAIGEDRYAQVWMVPGGRPYVEFAEGDVRYVEDRKAQTSLPLFYLADAGGKVRELPLGHEDRRSAETTTQLIGSSKNVEVKTLQGKKEDLTEVLPVCRRRQYTYYTGVYHSTPTVVQWGVATQSGACYVQPSASMLPAPRPLAGNGNGNAGPTVTYYRTYSGPVYILRTP
jgi:hypothetical protein